MTKTTSATPTHYLANYHYMANQTPPFGHVVPNNLTTATPLTYGDAHKPKVHYLANFATGTGTKIGSNNRQQKA